MAGVHRFDGVEDDRVIPQRISGSLSGSPINGSVQVVLNSLGEAFSPSQRDIYEYELGGTTLIKGPITSIRSGYVDQNQAIEGTEQWILVVDDMARQLKERHLPVDPIIIRAGATTISGSDPLTVAEQVDAVTGSETPWQRLSNYVSTYLPDFTLVGGPVASTVSFVAPDFNLAYSSRSHWKNLIDIATFAGWAIRIYPNNTIRVWDPVNNPRVASFEISDVDTVTPQVGGNTIEWAYSLELEEVTTGLANVLPILYNGEHTFVLEHAASIAMFADGDFDGRVMAEAALLIPEIKTLAKAKQIGRRWLRDRALPIWSGKARIAYRSDIEPGMEVWCHQVDHSITKRVYVRGIKYVWSDLDAEAPTWIDLDFGSEVWNWPGLPNPVAREPELPDFGPIYDPSLPNDPIWDIVGPGSGDPDPDEPPVNPPKYASGEWRIVPLSASGNDGSTDPAIIYSAALHNSDGSTTPRAYSRRGLGGVASYNNTHAHFTPSTPKWGTTGSAWNLTAMAMRRMFRVKAVDVDAPSDITRCLLYLPVQDGTGTESSAPARTARVGIVADDTFGGYLDGTETSEELWQLGGDDRLSLGQQFDLDGTVALHRIVADFDGSAFITAGDGAISMGLLWNPTAATDEDAGTATSATSFVRAWIGYLATFNSIAGGPSFTDLVPTAMSGYDYLVWAGPHDPTGAYESSEDKASETGRIELGFDPTDPDATSVENYAWAMIQLNGDIVEDDEAEYTYKVYVPGVDFETGDQTITVPSHKTGSLRIFLQQTSLGETTQRELDPSSEWYRMEGSLTTIYLGRPTNRITLSADQGQASSIPGDVVSPDVLTVFYIPETVNGGTGGPYIEI